MRSARVKKILWVYSNIEFPYEMWSGRKANVPFYTWPLSWTCKCMIRRA